MTPPPATPPADPVVAYLADHDATCPVCDYGLRGVPAPTCPECAAPLHLEVASNQAISSKAAPGPWLLALGAWTLALGFDGVMSLIFTTVIVVARPPLAVIYPYALAGTFITLSAATVVGISHVLRSRRRWSAKPRRAQWRDAAVSFIAVAAAHAAVGAALVIAG